MPPIKRATRQTPRRSSRRTVIEDDEPSEAEGEEAAPNMTAHEEEELVMATTDTTDVHEDTYHDEAMQEPEPSESANTLDRNPTLTHNPQEPTPDHASDPPLSSSEYPPSRPRDPVQRLTSVLPAAGLRSRPTRPTLISSASADPEPHTDPSTRASALKFKPKSFVRRSKEEREAAEKAEAERRAARLAADAGTATAVGGGRGGRAGRGRGRGGTSSSHGSGGQRGDASYDRSARGVLGGASVVEKRARGRRGTQNGVEEVGGEDDDIVDEEGMVIKAGGGKGKETVKEEPVVKPEVDKDGDVEMDGATPRKRKRETATAGKGKGKARVKKEDDLPTYISSEGEFDSDTAEKINIEAINLVSSEEEEGSGTELQGLSEVVKGKQNEREAAKTKTAERKKPKNWMMRPVHVERLEHVERETEVNTEASSLTSAGLRKKARERKEGQGGLFVSDGEGEGVGAGGGRKGRRKQKDVEFVKDTRRWKGVWAGDENEEEKVQVKDEPNDEEDVTIVDAPRALEKDDEVPGAEEMAGDDVFIGVPVTEIGGAMAKKGDPEGEMALDKQDAAQQETSDEEESTEEDSEEDESGEELPLLDIQLDDDDDDDDNDDDDDLEIELTDDDMSEESVLKLSLVAQSWRNRLELSSTSALLEKTTATDTKPPPAFVTNDPEIKDARHRKTYLMQLPPLIPSLRDIATKPTTIKKEKKPKIEPIPSSTNPFTAPHPMDAVKTEGSAPPSSTAADNQKILNAVHQPASASNFANGSAGTIAFHASGKTLASWGDMTFEVSEREAGGLAQETVMMEYGKVVTKLEEQDRWVDVVTVGGDGSGDGEGKKVGFSGGAVKGGFCLLGA